MKSVFDQWTDDLRSRLGMAPDKPPMPSLESLKETEQCPEFRRLRDARLIIGAFRYGMMGASHKKYDRIGNCIERLLLYQQDGNKEHLLDVANLCELEWVENNNPLAHYTPADDKHHCERL